MNGQTLNRLDEPLLHKTSSDNTFSYINSYISFRNQARTIDQPEPPTEYQFPFLPSYLMAVSKTRMNEQTTETLTENTSLFYNNIV